MFNAKICVSFNPRHMLGLLWATVAVAKSPDFSKVFQVFEFLFLSGPSLCLPSFAHFFQVDMPHQFFSGAKFCDTTA
jgi:hypothetical protein